MTTTGTIRHDRRPLYAATITALAERSHSIATLSAAIGASTSTTYDCVRRLEADGIVTKRKTGTSQSSPCIVTLVMSVDDALALAGCVESRPRMTFDGLLAAWPMSAHPDTTEACQ